MIKLGVFQRHQSHTLHPVMASTSYIAIIIVNLSSMELYFPNIECEMETNKIELELKKYGVFE